MEKRNLTVMPSYNHLESNKLKYLNLSKLKWEISNSCSIINNSSINKRTTQYVGCIAAKCIIVVTNPPYQ